MALIMLDKLSNARLSSGVIGESFDFQPPDGSIAHKINLTGLYMITSAHF